MRIPAPSRHLIPVTFARTLSTGLLNVLLTPTLLVVGDFLVSN